MAARFDPRMARYDPRMHAYDDRTRTGGVIYVLMLVVALAFGGFVWQLYAAPETPRISAEPGPYKVAPPPETAGAPDPAEQNAFYDALDGSAAPGTVTPRPGPEQPVEQAASTLAPAPGAAPAFVADGPYVAQLAALQSDGAVDAAWRRLSSRSPDLFARARMDVERADLGARGVYYRVRAGYFADRANATLFCDRIRRLGQDCIVSAR